MHSRGWVIWRIARHELTQYRRDGLFRAGALLLGAAVTLGLVAGSVHYARIEATRVEASAREQARWLGQPPRDPHSASHFGQSAFHQRSALSAIDSGVDPYVGVSVFLESHKRNFPRFPWVADTARWQGLGHYTAATALRIFLPLFLILLAHDAVVGERERGTLALMAATGVKPWALIAGKGLGVGIALALVAVPVTIAGAMTLALTAAPAATAAAPTTIEAMAAAPRAVALAATPGQAWPLADLLPRALALMAAYGAYSLVFIAITLAVSARVRSVGAARAVLLSFWALSALVAPRAVADVAQLRHPVPSRIEFERELAQDTEAGPRGAAVYEAFKRDVLAKYGVKTIEELPVNFSGLWLQRGEERGDKVIDRHFGELQAVYDATARFYAHASWLGPTLAVDAVSMAMAGSDLGHYARFLDDAEGQRRAMVRALNEDLTRHPPGAPQAATAAAGQTPAPGGARTAARASAQASAKAAAAVSEGAAARRPYRAGPELWRQIGTFVPRPGAWRWAFTENPAGFVALAAWLIAGACALAVAARSLARQPLAP